MSGITGAAQLSYQLLHAFLAGRAELQAAELPAAPATRTALAAGATFASSSANAPGATLARGAPGASRVHATAGTPLARSATLAASATASPFVANSGFRAACKRSQKKPRCDAPTDSTNLHRNLPAWSTP